MNESLDEFLNRMGIEQSSPPSEEAVAEEVETTTSIAPVVSSEAMSADEFNHLLNEVGFQTPPEAEAEEVHDGSDDTTEWETASVDPTADEEYDENMGEGRDLDAEEDADWDRLEQDGIITSASVSEQEPIYVGNGIIDQVTQIANTIGGSLRFDGENIVAEDGTIVASPSELEVSVIPDSAFAPTTDQEVHFHMPDGSVVDVPITEESIGVDIAAPEEVESLPENSPTLSMDTSTSRFSGAEWYARIQQQSVIVAGLGGIGSHLSFQLARMGLDALYLYDDDAVEIGNMSGQLYGRNHIGLSKAQALKIIIGEYASTYSVYANNLRFDESTPGCNIMMCGFDNMAARKIFFNVWRRHVNRLNPEEKKQCLYLDGRLSIDALQVFCITGDDEFNMKKYQEEYLFDDSEADATVCSLKQTTYMACMIGSFMVNLFTNFIANQGDPIIPYDLPFFTEYDSQSMIFKTVR